MPRALAQGRRRAGAVLGEGDLAGGAAPSPPVPAHRRPHRRPERSPRGPRASSRNRTISRRWVRVLGVASLCRNPATTWVWPGPVGHALLPRVDVARLGARWACQGE